MNLPLDFNSAEPWTRIVKIALTIATVYAIAVVGLFVKGNFLGGAVLLGLGLAFWSSSLSRCRDRRFGATPCDTMVESPIARYILEACNVWSSSVVQHQENRRSLGRWVPSPNFR